MSVRPPDNELFEQIHRLVTARIVGETTPEQLAELDALLVRSPAARQLYLQYLYDSLTLPSLLGASGPHDASYPPLEEEPGEPPFDTVASAPPAAPVSEPFVLPIIIDTSSPTAAPLTSMLFAPGSWAFSYAVATLITGMLLLGAWAYRVSHDSQFATLENRREPAAPEVDAAEEQVVGRITGTADCRWANPQDAPPAAVPLGRRYALASGLMEISYQTGAKVILQGPCAYEVDSPAGGFLSLGKLTARVGERGEGRGERDTQVRSPKSETRNPRSQIPNQQISNPQSPIFNPQFVVRTPTAVVTDLGTEFGVETRPDGVTEAVVFVGKVAVTAVADEDSGSREPRIVSAGQSVRSDSLGITVVAAEPGSRPVGVKFVRVLPQPKSLSDAYAEIVLALRPVAYYRMERPKEEKDRLVLFDSAPGGRHGKLHWGTETGQPWLQGRFGDALNLGGADFGDYAVAPRLPDSGTNQFSLSAWVLCGYRTSWARIAEEAGPEPWRFSIGLYGNDGDLHAAVGQTDGTPASFREGPAKPFATGVWQHVAMVADGLVLHVYRNGAEVGSVPCKGVVKAPAARCLTIGCGDVERRRGDVPVNIRCFWEGRLDEIALFDRALAPKEIGLLFCGPAARPDDAENRQPEGGPQP